MLDVPLIWFGAVGNVTVTVRPRVRKGLSTAPDIGNFGLSRLDSDTEKDCSWLVVEILPSSSTKEIQYARALNSGVKSSFPLFTLNVPYAGVATRPCVRGV